MKMMRKLMASTHRISLALRLILVASIWVTLALIVAGFFLVKLFQDAGQKALDDRLDVHMTEILSAIARNPGKPFFAVVGRGEPRFSVPQSGWYWTVRLAEDPDIVLFDSPSLFSDQLNISSLDVNNTLSEDFHLSFKGPAGAQLRALARTVRFERRTSYLIVVAGSTQELGESISAFTNQATIMLVILGLGLILAIFIQVHFGLRPIRTLQRSLLDIRKGQAETINDQMPRELQPLVHELNALVKSNRQIVERARAHVGNLAHALKTPLAVIMNETRSQSDDVTVKVHEQTLLMNEQIKRYLEKARMAAQRRVVGVACPVEPVCKSMAQTMKKIYRDKQIVFELNCNQQIAFRGERQDLQEILGNLLDNACKWCVEKVAVSAQIHGNTEEETFFWQLIVEDDGPGLSTELQQQALKRGKRLDENVPGSGLGLSILADLAEVYGGSIQLDTSRLGGLKVLMFLPMTVVQVTPNP